MGSFLPLLIAAVFIRQAACVAVATAQKPNILLLFPDQWRWDWRGSTSANLDIKTPVFDSVSSKGSLFHSAYVASVCACLFMSVSGLSSFLVLCASGTTAPLRPQSGLPRSGPGV
jgi:arylsulfatase A-like enzyme